MTAYDASYLWLARKLDAELVTPDEQLTAAVFRRQCRALIIAPHPGASRLIA